MTFCYSFSIIKGIIFKSGVLIFFFNILLWYLLYLIFEKTLNGTSQINMSS